MSYIALINNLALLLVLTIPYQYILRKWQRDSLNARIATGLLFSTLTVIGMKVSVPFAPGIIFDARSVFVSVGSLFGGPIVMGMVSVVAALYRIWLGGSGVPMGVGVIASSAALGGLFYYLRQRGHNTTRPLMLLTLGFLVHIIMISYMPFLPTPYSDQALALVASRVIVVFPLGTLILGTVLADIESRVNDEKSLRENEQKLRDSEQRYRAITEDIPLLICRYNANGDIIFVNQAYCDFFGKTAQELIGKSFFTLIPEQDREITRKTIASLSIETPTLPNVHRVVTPSGEMRWQRWTDRAVFDENNTIIAYQAIGEDITQQKQNEDRLKEREAFLHAVYENNLVGIMVADDQGNYRSANQAAATMLGYSVETLLKMNVIQLKRTEKTHNLRQRFKEFVKKGQEIGEFETVRPDGSIRLLQYHAMKIDTDFNLSILADITDRAQTEMETRRINNLESLGLLAGGIAHDFNNILTGVTGNLSLLERLLDPKSEAFEILKEAVEATHRTRGLTQQLMTFAKGGEPIKETIDLKDHIKKTTQQSLRGSNTYPEFLIAENLSPVQVDTHQINQVIQNLVINADQAMPNGGTITVMANNVTISETDAIPLPSGTHIKVSIKDQGTGIPPDLMHRIFDPYFSTKDTGHGLGLSICHSIIQRHNGHITVDTSKKEGTTFTLYLPALPQTEINVTPSTKQTFTGTGRILLMDDEEIVHNTVTRALIHLGYDVESVYNGTEALHVFQNAQKENQPFDLVIMDLTIPGGMGGVETIRELRKQAPNARVIVASGYSKDPILTNPKAHGFDGALTKPITIEEMSAVINKVLSTI